MSIQLAVGLGLILFGGFAALIITAASLLRCKRCGRWHLEEMECEFYELPKTKIVRTRQYGCVKCQKRHIEVENPQLFWDHIWHQSKHGWDWIAWEIPYGASVLDKSGQDQLPRQDGPSVCSDGPEVGSHR